MRIKLLLTGLERMLRICQSRCRTQSPSALARKPLKLVHCTRLTRGYKPSLQRPSENHGSPIQEDECFDAYREALESDKPLEASKLDTRSLVKVLPRTKALHATPVLRKITEGYLGLPDVDASLGKTLMEVDASMQMLGTEQVMETYKRLLSNPTDADSLSTKVLIHIGRVSLLEKEHNIGIMESVFTSIIQRWVSERGVGHEGHLPGTWVAFCLLHAISRMDLERGRWCFRDLLLARPSWPPGSTEVPEAISDQTIIMMVFTLRCCISWRWWERAFMIVKQLISVPTLDRQSAETLMLLFVTLGHDYMDAMKHTFNPQLCAALICTLADHPLFPCIDEALIQRFYKECASTSPSYAYLVDRVYLHLRSKALVPRQTIREEPPTYDTKALTKPPHAYLPPRGRALVYLLSHYSLHNNQNAARLLIADTKERITTISPTLLSTYLHKVIRMSFAADAREIYEICKGAQDSERQGIARNPGVVRQLVSLFTSMANGSYERSQTHKDPGRAEYHAQKAVEFAEFARSVVLHYRRTSPNLRQWEHHDLTTLARISFEVGLYRDGITALEAIINHPDFLPDAYDISIFLNALASGSPHDAVGFLQLMFSRSIEPEDSAYGVVIAHCLKHCNPRLAQSVINTARSRGRDDLDTRLLGAICWHNLSPRNLRGTRRHEIIKRLLLVLDTLGPNAREQETVFRERTLGIRGAEVALSVNRPDIAFRFWMRCIQYKSIVRQPDDAVVSTRKDSEKRLRMDILTALEAKKRKAECSVGPQGTTTTKRFLGAFSGEHE